jgi:two-component system response regulator RegA
MEMIMRPDRSLFIVEDDATFAKTLKRSFEKRDYDVVVCPGREELARALETAVPAYAVVDLKLGAGGSGLECVKLLSARDASMRIVVLTGFASIATAVEAIKRGACNYLCKPADADDVLAALLSEHADLDTLVPENPMSVDRLQWEHIQRVLTEHEGNISATARALGLHRRTLQRKLQKRPVRR